MTGLGWVGHGAKKRALLVTFTQSTTCSETSELQPRCSAWGGLARALTGYWEGIKLVTGVWSHHYTVQLP